MKLDDSDFVALPPLAAALKTSGDQASQVEVVLAATLTPVGTLQLECVDPVDERQRWNVEFQIRRELAQQRREDSSRIASLPVQFETARELLQTVFGPRRKGVDPNAVKRLRKALEQVLGRQDLWEVPVLRALCDELIEYGGNRRRSVHHERVWLSLTGLGLRPGFGYPLDEWRLRQIWPLFDQGLQHTGDAQAWSAWWIFWRRVAGGLDEVQQQRIFEKIEGDISSAGARGRKPTVDVRSKSIDDMLRLAASLEQLPVSVKVRLAKWLVTGLKRSGGSPTGWWALGRVAARELLHGSAHTVIPADTVSRWLPLLLAEDWRRNQDAAFAAVMVARMTGDRGRDVSDSDRCRVVEKLRLARAPERWRLMVSEVQVLDELETQRFFGEKLPAGLRLVD